MPGRNTRNAADVERRAGGCAQILAGHANAPDGATRRSPIGGGALLHLCWRVSAGRRSRGSDTPVSLNADRKRSGKLAASLEFDLELLNIVRLGQRRFLYYQGPATTGCTAARASRPEGCRGRSTRAPAAWLATSPRPRPIRPRASSAKRSRCCFAHLKRILKLDRLRFRGPNGARDEFHLAATTQNLRKLAKLVPAPRQRHRDR
jgi:hypothetical protein